MKRRRNLGGKGFGKGRLTRLGVIGAVEAKRKLPYYQGKLSL